MTQSRKLPSLDDVHLDGDTETAHHLEARCHWTNLVSARKAAARCPAAIAAGTTETPEIDLNPLSRAPVPPV
jgi:hypothetical protein